MIAEVKHALGYTPARMLWSDKLQDENYINKRSPITDILADLDWYLFFRQLRSIWICTALSDLRHLRNGRSGRWRCETYFAEGEREAKDHKGKGLLGLVRS